MEVVRQFSNELNSVYDSKLPVSRAKMASITKLAMKAAKFYKHVVMIVEKFISKCGPEFKVPGLYVVDSIVRQSRHQFGAEKDSFGPRFAKNFQKTFQGLFQCAPEDKPKVIRVLNLWQKNGVFSPEVIQPLLSLAPNPAVPPPSAPPPSIPPPSSSSTSSNQHSALDLDSANVIIHQQQQQISALLQQQQQLQSQANSLLAPTLQGIIANSGGVQTQTDALVTLLQQTQQLQQLQAIQQQLVGTNGNPPPGQGDEQPVFNQALLDDFDYSDEEEEDVEKRIARQRERLQAEKTRLGEHDTSASESPTDFLERLQQQFREQESAIASANTQPPEVNPPSQPPLNSNNNLKQSPPPPLPPATGPFPPPGPPPTSHHLSYPPPPIPPPHIHDHHPPPLRDWHRPTHPPPPHPPHPSHPPHPPHPSHPPPPLPPHYSQPPRSPSPRMRRDIRGFHSPPPPLHRRSRSPPHHHWRDRWSPPRRRSRSPPPRRRSRSPMTPPPRRRVSPPLSVEERERQRKGIPRPKEKHVTDLHHQFWSLQYVQMEAEGRPGRFSHPHICSMTIWMGHLAKSVTQAQITQAFEDFGQVKSVDVVHARGCAYIVMVHRSDAVRALHSLRDLRLNGNTCKLAWAPGRGVKGAAYKSYWELELGVSFVPWELIRSQKDLNEIAEGGWIDPSTCPPGTTAPLPPQELEESSGSTKPEKAGGPAHHPPTTSSNSNRLVEPHPVGPSSQPLVPTSQQLPVGPTPRQLGPQVVGPTSQQLPVGPTPRQLGPQVVGPTSQQLPVGPPQQLGPPVVSAPQQIPVLPTPQQIPVRSTLQPIPVGPPPQQLPVRPPPQQLGPQQLPLGPPTSQPLPLAAPNPTIPPPFPLPIPPQQFPPPPRPAVPPPGPLYPQGPPPSQVFSPNLPLPPPILPSEGPDTREPDTIATNDDMQIDNSPETQTDSLEETNDNN